MGSQEGPHQEHGIKHSPAGRGRGAMWISQGRKVETTSETDMLEVAPDKVCSGPISACCGL